MQNTSPALSEHNDTFAKAKITIIGDNGVGKSSLIQVFQTILCEPHLESFEAVLEQTKATIGFDSVTATFRLSESQKVKLNIWDTAGQEKYRSISRSLYRGTHGILICFDLTKSLTVESIKIWLHEVRQHIGEECSKVIVGTKSDGAVNEETFRVLTTFAVENKLKFIQTSALEGTNVYFAFEFLIKKIVPRLRKRRMDVLKEKIDSQRSFVINKKRLASRSTASNISEQRCCALL